jgi:ubiquinone/menaquinone biosynthesis C-methylase UbiE
MGSSDRLRHAVHSLLTSLGIVPVPPDYLRQQVVRTWEKELRNLKWFGLADGMSIADIGCGPAHFDELLVATFPNARLTVVDSAAATLEAARARLGARATFVEARADETTLASDSFDFVIARLLFQHLSDPSAVTSECLRILKPGGRLVIIDIDDRLFGVVQPRLAGVTKVFARYRDAQRRRGGNRHVGATLVRVLRDTGFHTTQLEAVAIHSDEAGIGACFPQFDEMPLRSLVSAGQLSEADYTTLRAAHREFLRRDPYALILLFMACGTK